MAGKTKQLAVAVVVLATFAGMTLYANRNSKTELVTTADTIDFSTLYPANPGCSIASPDGRSLDLSSSQVIPKGTLITSQCFGAVKH